MATGAPVPEVYHGGSVMAGGLTVHTIFWSGGTHPFQGQPAGAPANYEGMIEQFFTDVAHDSGSTANIFSTLPQYAEGQTPGQITPGAYSISFNNATDAVLDSDPYPAIADQCASPNNASVCITDAQVQAEVDKIIQATPGTPRGLHNLWYVFLPPDVDECITPGVCGTNAFGGYHSVSDVGHGVTIYALTIDPIIEVGLGPGSDPEGYPDAEATIDIAAHETNEAMTDPEGVGYMDPNGFEVADKCEVGPQRGTPLGFAPDGSPYNQVINGHEYLIQMIWSNDDNSCVERTTSTSNPLPLPQVYLSQFSSTVSGNLEDAVGGVGVKVSLVRADANGNPVTVAQAVTTTAGDGTWSVSLAPHAIGDDRDEIDIDYSNSGAPSPSHQTILTGNGGNPFTESGWTGWTSLDNGTLLTNNPALGGPSISLAPCFQTGVLAVTRNGTQIMGPLGEDPTDFCNTQTDAATVPLASNVTASDVFTASSLDNRAFINPNDPPPYVANTIGGLIGLTVPVGEADAASPFVDPLPFFTPSGFPTCSADLEGQSVTCQGLVPLGNYTVIDGGTHAAGTADAKGVLTVPVAVKRGDTVGLSNGARLVTTLHVANLRADILGHQTVLSGGSCQPGDYYDPPLSTAPTNASAGVPTALAGGGALTGEICPLTGDATGLPAIQIVQTDEFSQGQTSTEVPDLENTSPLDGEIVYGRFTVLGQSGLPGPNNSVIPDQTSQISVTITRASGGGPVFTAANVNTVNGTGVPKLPKGSYDATWEVTDVNGDTRTVTTRFIEQGASAGRKHPKFVVGCKVERHGEIRCTITFARSSHVRGRVQVRLARGSRIAALGHAAIKGTVATLTMRPLRKHVSGRWTMTVVVTQPGARPTTSIAKVLLR
ncbi:MAG: hypothetical protein JO325_14955 [Solirubrobacterales bacterium]|nr:hypothetical protein [Solirubrobacterales bacterium]